MSHQIERKFTIGRARTCDIVLADDSVSRQHAELTFLPEGKLLLTDCRSSHGTALLTPNGAQPIRQELLSPLDNVQFGDIRMPVKELLEAIRLKFPSFEAGGVRQPGVEPTPQRPWVQGERLVRCTCGAVKSKGSICKECGA